VESIGARGQTISLSTKLGFASLDSINIMDVQPCEKCMPLFGRKLDVGWLDFQGGARVVGLGEVANGFFFSGFG
jgi:hypothetical protein